MTAHHALLMAGSSAFPKFDSAVKASNVVLSNSDRTMQLNTAVSSWNGVRSTRAYGTAGQKRYVEVVGSGSSFGMFGLADTSHTGWPYATAPGGGGQYHFWHTGGSRMVNGVSNAGIYATYTIGDVLGVALDISGNTLQFYKNGVAQAIQVLPSANPLFFVIESFNTTTAIGTVNAAPQFLPSGFTYWEP